MLIQPLFDGPLDIVGDIHGEIDALRSLLGHLGYVEGEHPEGRRLVFVGDLCDRGPDSVAVIELVRDLIERQRAQCIMGNHELNVLRGTSKPGNRWILDPAHPESATVYGSRLASPDERASIESFFRTLPLALERPDLRVVHATWHDASIDALRTTTDSNIDAFTRYEDALKRTLDESGLRQAGKAELAAHTGGLEDPTYAMPMLTAVGQCEEQRQMLNPIRVLTSGPERSRAVPFFATGKWRFCERVKWWAEYTSPMPVVVGHYWRGSEVHAGEPDLFEGVEHHEWTGPERNVYCVDFSVGRRFRERSTNGPYRTRLAALRWPERRVTFDDGNTVTA